MHRERFMRQLRILFINSTRIWGGATVWLMDVMHGLHRRGHQVTLVCRPQTILAREARAEGFEVIPIAMRGDLDPVVICKVLRLMRQKRTQVLCTDREKELRFGGIAARLRRGVVVVPSQEVDCPLKDKLRYRFTYNFLADYILANSYATKNTLVRSVSWLDPHRVEVVYKGIDPQPYLASGEAGMALRRDLHIAPDTKLVGFVGRIDAEKGIPDIVHSIPLVLKHMPGVKFLFVGTGPLQGFLSTKIQELTIADSVIYAGFRKDIPAVMHAIDVLILPSHAEGFGYVLIEAMAAAKPIVATNVGGIPEIVKQGETGFLIGARQPHQLAEAIVTVLQNETLQRRLGNNGREVVLERFALESMVSHIESIFLDKVYS
jgi:glycosyltransferase involved in cell wall biosynthesis